MGRTRSFDRNAVLAAAANLFRQRGFREVSIADLEEATGMVSGSIYNAFGDKAGLFTAALDYYVNGYVRERLTGMGGADARLEDLERLYLSVLEPPMSDGHGCLINNSIIEFGRNGGIAAADIERTLDMVRWAIDGVLKRELGSASSDSDTTRLLVLYHGILTLSRSPMPLGAMADAVRAEFDRLRKQRDDRRAGEPLVTPKSSRNGVPPCST